MTISIYCDNKGCFKQNEALLNVDNDEVLCAECGKSITNVTVFMKTQLRASGQIKRFNKKQQTFSVKCPFCEKESCPKLAEKQGLVCSQCGESLEDKLSKPYVLMIKDVLKTHRPPS